MSPFALSKPCQGRRFCISTQLGWTVQTVATIARFQFHLPDHTVIRDLSCISASKHCLTLHSVECLHASVLDMQLGTGRKSLIRIIRHSALGSVISHHMVTYHPGTTPLELRPLHPVHLRSLPVLQQAFEPRGSPNLSILLTLLHPCVEFPHQGALSH